MGYTYQTKPKIPAGFQTISPTSGVSLGLTVPTDACYAIIKAYQYGIRVRDDGTSPTSAGGFYLAAGNEMILTSREQIKAIKAISATDSTGSLEVLYYKLK